MYAVIFRARINEMDDGYQEMAEQMRERAIGLYGCIDFVSVTEGLDEITISYWESQEQIRDWKQDAKHLIAQELGRTKWYTSYQVQVVEIVRDYSLGGNFD